MAWLIIGELIKHDAIINEQNCYGCISLHLASIHGYYEIVKKLLHNGAHVNIIDSVGNTSLHYASMFGRLDIVKEVLPYSDLSIKNCNGKVALDLANIESIKRLIQDYENDLELLTIKEPDC